MSSDDPSDDELDREAARDVPLALGGTRRHSPKLSDEPRGINLREMRPILEAERAAASPAQGGYVGVDRGDPRHFPQPAPNPVVQLVRTPRQAEPQRDTASAEAWDRYVVAALAIAGNTADACAAADALLIERRRRFG